MTCQRQHSTFNITHYTYPIYIRNNQVISTHTQYKHIHNFWMILNLVYTIYLQDCLNCIQSPKTSIVNERQLNWWERRLFTIQVMQNNRKASNCVFSSLHFPSYYYFIIIIIIILLLNFLLFSTFFLYTSFAFNVTNGSSSLCYNKSG